MFPLRSFLMVLIGVGTYAYRRDDGAPVVPLSTRSRFLCLSIRRVISATCVSEVSDMV